jgi:hypothetical protein
MWTGIASLIFGWILVSTVGQALGVACFARPAVAQNSERELEQPPWQGRYLPAGDGLFGLRYGMDRESCAKILPAKDLAARTASSADQLRFAGRVLGEDANVTLHFVGVGTGGGGERLARIVVRWSYDGALRSPRRIFESLDTLMVRRYGQAVQRYDGSWPAIENGSDLRARAYMGPETEAVLEIRGVREDLYRVELRLEFPPWAEQL